MKKFLLAITLATFAGLVAMTGVKAAPVATGNLSQSAIQAATIEGLTLVHRRGPRHNCRRHGRCGYGWGGGWGDGWRRGRRSCRRVRRFCRREWDGGRRYRRCVRRRGCRP